jgi:hypothetical protein
MKKLMAMMIVACKRWCFQKNTFKCVYKKWEADICIVDGISGHPASILHIKEIRELSGYLVFMFMSAWKDEELQLPSIKVETINIYNSFLYNSFLTYDVYMLIILSQTGWLWTQKAILGQLLTLKENKCEDNTY